MRLTDLEPEWVRATATGQTRYEVTRETADGVLFGCPTCFVKNGNTMVGTHMILCWQPHVPADRSPGPGRWTFAGTDFADLTLNPSVSLPGPGGCLAHFFIRNGVIDMV